VEAGRDDLVRRRRPPGISSMRSERDMKDQELLELNDLEIEPLTDDELDSVVGGLCSIILCSVVQRDPDSN
jgi:bacteriocin-like protein